MTGLVRCGLVALAVLVTCQQANAQLTYQRGQNVSPAFEGWEANDDGSFSMVFGYMNNTASNRNIPDPRNWQGAGNRSVANMFIDLGMKLSLSDEQFVEEMAERRAVFNLGINDHVVGCPLCMVIPN